MGKVIHSWIVKQMKRLMTYEVNTANWHITNTTKERLGVNVDPLGSCETDEAVNDITSQYCKLPQNEYQTGNGSVGMVINSWIVKQMKRLMT